MRRVDGYAPIASYGVIGDGRSVAFIAPDGAVDWWCAPNLDNDPILDKLINATSQSGYEIMVIDVREMHCGYDRDSNVVVCEYKTKSGAARITYSLNSGSAGRLPWSELATRITITEGTVRIKVQLTLEASWQIVQDHAESCTWTDGSRLLTSLAPQRLLNNEQIFHTNDSQVLALIVTNAEPHFLPSLESVNHRIDLSNEQWKNWSKQITYNGPYARAVIRSALALKLLVYTPSGAVAAAGTTSLPERIGGDKNYDYRYAWIRDTAYTIKAFIRAGLTEEVQAALAWLLTTIDKNGTNPPNIFYTLDGDMPEDVTKLAANGYRNSKPVTKGNQARDQLQLGIFGDLLETVHLFIRGGNELGAKTASVIEALVESCAQLWKHTDSGIWELNDKQHYTLSKIGCWLTFDRAIELCELNVLDIRNIEHWKALRQEVYEYIEANCWNAEVGAYMQYAGSAIVDASLMLATRFGYPHKEHLRSTLQAITVRLQQGPYVYRYETAKQQEGAFIACSYWLVEGYAFLGMHTQAEELMDGILKATQNDYGLLSEMVDPETGDFLGNMPQALSHLALIHAADALATTE
jgi:GH15 family glucan-1,4-alpha-glucosidase